MTDFNIVTLKSKYIVHILIPGSYLRQTP